MFPFPCMFRRANLLSAPPARAKLFTFCLPKLKMHRKTAPCHHGNRPLLLLLSSSLRPQPQHQHRCPCPRRPVKSYDAVPAAASLQTGRPAAAVVAATAAAATPGAAADGASSSNSSSDWRSLLVTKAVEPGQLVKLMVKGKIKGDAASLVLVKPTAGSSTTAAAPAAGPDDSGSSSSSTPGSMPYKQLAMRPVLIKGRVMLQVSLLTARQVGQTGCASSWRLHYMPREMHSLGFCQGVQQHVTAVLGCLARWTCAQNVCVPALKKNPAPAEGAAHGLVPDSSRHVHALKAPNLLLLA